MSSHGSAAHNQEFATFKTLMQFKVIKCKLNSTLLTVVHTATITSEVRFLFVAKLGVLMYDEIGAIGSMSMPWRYWF